jgi:hypothetical protein
MRWLWTATRFDGQGTAHDAGTFTSRYELRKHAKQEGWRPTRPDEWTEWWTRGGDLISVDCEER